MTFYTVYVCVPIDGSDQPIPGDPLFPGAPAARSTPQDQSLVNLSATKSTEPQPPKNPRTSRSRLPQEGSIWVKPGTRLTFSVVAVFFATVALGQSDENIAVGPAETTVPGQFSQEQTGEKKFVLVSDPANTAIVREIAGDLLDVESLVPPGANGHTYEPVPSDAIKATRADLYIENGMELNDAVTNFVRANYRQGTKEVTLSEVIPPAEVISSDSAEEIASHGHAHSFNAHFWTDPIYAIAYASRVIQALEALDPANAATYKANGNAFIGRLRILDTKFKDAIQSIPEATRKLVVYHDSWSYFGRRYGIPVVGAIQPVSFSEPSANEIRRMIDQIRNERVPAFFGSEVFPSDVLQAIAAETGAKYYSDLSDEELPGEPGTSLHSYEGMMIQNVRLITSALGGNVSILDDLTPKAIQ